MSGVATNGTEMRSGEGVRRLELRAPLTGQRVPQRKRLCIAYCCDRLKKFCRRCRSMGTPVDSNYSVSIPLETGAQKLAQLKEALRASIPKTTGFMVKTVVSTTSKKREEALKGLVELAKRYPSLKDDIVAFLNEQSSIFSDSKYNHSHSGIVSGLNGSSRELSKLNNTSLGTEGRN